MFPYYLIIILAFTADRLSKLWMEAYLTENGPIFFTDWLTFYLTYNRGVAFGMFQGVGQVLGWVTLIVLVMILRYMQRLPPEFWLMRLGLALVLGGAAGNMIDRMWAGEVVDFIAVSFIPWVFNLADVAVNGGMAVALAGSFLHAPVKRDGEEQQAKGIGEEEE